MIKKIDPIEHVRKRKAMYLGREEVIPEFLATQIASDALTLGVSEVWIKHFGSWWIVGSAEDWLRLGHDLSVTDAFRKILPLPGGPPESFRREILLTAFADNVFVKKDQELIEIKGSFPSGAEWLSKLPNSHRIIAFDVL